MLTFILAIIFIGVILCGMGQFILRWFKPYRKFACKMGWHSWPSYSPIQDDWVGTFLKYAQCKWCGYKGQIDSQGNLF